MLNFTDRRYYSEFESRVTAYRETITYNTGDIVQFNEVYYEFIPADGTTSVGVTPGTDDAVWRMIDSLPELGYYQFVSLEDIVNNYFVLYGDEDLHSGGKKRTRIEAFAQRSIQEFSYNVFKVKELEQVVNDQFIIPFPQDYVSLVSISYVDAYGTERWLINRPDSGAPQSLLQDGESDDYAYTYDDDGRLITDNLNSRTIALLNNDPTDDEQYDGAATLDRYDEFNAGATQRRELSADAVVTGYSGSYSTYGKRYYEDTQTANQNATYVVNDTDGVIYLEPSVAGEVVTMRYVTDGLGGTPQEIKVHKFAEQAIYDSIYYEMIARSTTVPANEKERAKRKMIGKTREAKIRLSPVSRREMLQNLRGQSTWIKT